jgi:hypothetical protein
MQDSHMVNGTVKPAYFGWGESSLGVEERVVLSDAKLDLHARPWAVMVRGSGRPNGCDTV